MSMLLSKKVMLFYLKKNSLRGQGDSSCGRTCLMPEAFSLTPSSACILDTSLQGVVS